jgi:hypothetical protein
VASTAGPASNATLTIPDPDNVFDMELISFEGVNNKVKTELTMNKSDLNMFMYILGLCCVPFVIIYMCNYAIFATYLRASVLNLCIMFLFITASLLISSSLILKSVIHLLVLLKSLINDNFSLPGRDPSTVTVRVMSTVHILNFMVDGHWMPNILRAEKQGRPTIFKTGSGSGRRAGPQYYNPGPRYSRQAAAENKEFITISINFSCAFNFRYLFTELGTLICEKKVNFTVINYYKADPVIPSAPPNGRN